MSLITVVFELRKRRIITDGEAAGAAGNLPLGAPENWISKEYSFSFQSDDGLEESPGSVFVESVTRRKLVVLVPDGTPDPDDTSTYDSVTVLSGTRTFSGPMLLTDPRAAGMLSLSGDGETMLRIYYAEGEETDDVRQWPGLHGGGAVLA